jgi:hypothetical protein
MTVLERLAALRANGTYLSQNHGLWPQGSNSFDHWELAGYSRSNEFDPTGVFANSTLLSGISNCPYKRVEVLKEVPFRPDPADNSLSWAPTSRH